MSRPVVGHTNGLSGDKRQDGDTIAFRYRRGKRLLHGTTPNRCKPFIKALDPLSPIEISIECHDLVAPQRLLTRLSPRPHRQRLRPFAVFFYRQGLAASPWPQWQFVGRTETVLYDDYHRFVTKLKVCCATQQDTQKELRVELYDRTKRAARTEDQTFIGAAQCRLVDILSDSLLRKEMILESVPIDRPGSVVLSADALESSQEGRKLTLNVEMSSIIKGQHRLFFVLTRQLQFGGYTPVYRSEVLGRDEKKFRTVTLDIAILTAGVDGKLLRLELFQFSSRGEHIWLGFTQTSAAQLQSARRNTRLWWRPCNTCDDDSVIEVGRIMVMDSTMEDGQAQVRLRVTY